MSGESICILCLCCRKPTNGATPVPGPIIIIGLETSAGRRKFWLVRRYIGTHTGPLSSMDKTSRDCSSLDISADLYKEASQPVQMPFLAKIVAFSFGISTTLNTKDIFLEATRGEEVIEYALGRSCGKCSRRVVTGGLHVWKMHNKSMSVSPCSLTDFTYSLAHSLLTSSCNRLFSVGSDVHWTKVLNKGFLGTDLISTQDWKTKWRELLTGICFGIAAPFFLVLGSTESSYIFSATSLIPNKERKSSTSSSLFCTMIPNESPGS